MQLLCKLLMKCGINLLAINLSVFVKVITWDAQRWLTSTTYELWLVTS